MNYKHLKTFITVCETGSMTAAAEKLFISQPAISAVIREMEATYGMQLFDRAYHKLIPTEFGKGLYAYAKRFEQLSAEMDNYAASKKANYILRVGTGIAFGKLYIPTILSRFRALYKNCIIKLRIDSSEVIEPLLADSQLDLIIAEGTSHAPDFMHQELSRAPIIAVCHEDHPLAQMQSVTAEMLSCEDLLFREPGCPTREIVDTYFSAHNLTVSPVMESISVLSLLNAARSKCGIAFLPSDHFFALPHDHLVRLNLPDFQFNRYIDVIYRNNMSLTPLAEEFINFTKSIVHELEAQYQ